MKILVSALTKGGVGKTMLTCQLARYAAIKGMRVLVIDMDDQGNATQSLERDQFTTRLPQTISQVLNQFDRTKYEVFDYPKTALVAADGHLTSTVVEYAKKPHGDILYQENVNKNYTEFINLVDEHYDLCVIDFPPATDLRITTGLGTADAVISPFLLAQESIEGMGQFIKGQRGILTIKNYNPNLDFIGFIPNAVEKTEKQRSVFEQLASSPFRGYLLANNAGDMLTIPKREAIKECQAIGLFIGDLAKTNSSAGEAWRKMRQVFDCIFARLDLLNEQIEKA